MHTAFTFQPVGRVFSENLVVFALESDTAFAALSTRVHLAWVNHTSSTLETRQGYRPTDCFETFPFPQPDPRAVIPALEAAGHALYQARAEYMRDTDQGLTKTYNALKDAENTEPPILHLRGLHEAMDRAVLDAYGWTDLLVPPYCPLTTEDQQALETFQDEVIDRLYVLNATRAKEERRLGAAQKGKGGDAGKGAGGRKGKAPPGQGGLFE